MRIREFLQLEEVVEAAGNLDQEVNGLTFDSRKVEGGQVFFAIPGEKTDGHAYIGAALERGAAAYVYSRPGSWPAGSARVRVNSVRRALGLWSAHFYGRPSGAMKLVGVTGTNGKTTLTYLIESVFKAAGLKPGVIGTINYRYAGSEMPSNHSTPESLETEELLFAMRRAGVNAVAMEVSSHALVQERVRGLDFDAGVFTNLSRDHLDYHRDMDDYFNAKSRLFTDYLPESRKSNKAAVIFGDDPRGAELLARARAAGLEAWSYGERSAWDVYPLAVEKDLGGLRGRLRAKGRTVEFSSPLIGAANLQNIMGALATGLALGFDAETIARGIGELRSVPGRLEKVANDRGVTVLVDYAHTPDALEKVLGALTPLSRGKMITVFGCGGDRDRGKRPLMGEIAARLSDVVVITSDNPRSEKPEAILRDVEAGVLAAGKARVPSGELKKKPGYTVEVDRRRAIGLAIAAAAAGDMVLIAGKGHEDYQILGQQKVHFDDREAAREALVRPGGP